MSAVSEVDVNTSPGRRNTAPSISHHRGVTNFQALVTYGHVRFGNICSITEPVQ
jgi:hypothetical protein